MTTLRVWTHWVAAAGSAPGAPLSPPAALAAYTPQPPRLAVDGTSPQFQQKWSVSPSVLVWAELARQTDIEAANWAGPGWPGSPPAPWPAPPAPPVEGDEGYGAAAVSFNVTALAVILRNIQNTAFTFTVSDPAGNFVGRITPASPQSSPGVYPVTVAGGPIAAVPNGKGIWTVAIERVPGSTVSEPGLYLGGPPGNPVLPTYVSPYGSQYEGILGLQFDGEEVICPTSKAISAEVEITVAGVTSWQPRANLTGANCLDIGQKLRLTATYANPSPVAGANYEWNFGDAASAPYNTQHPDNTEEHAYASADVYAAAVSLKAPLCQTLLTKVVEVCFKCPTKVEIQPSPPQALMVAGCAPAGGPNAIFNVVVTWPSPPPLSPPQVDYTWVINGPTGKYEITTDAQVSTSEPWMKTSVTPNTVGPVDLGMAGSNYSVSVTVNVVGIRPGCTLTDTRQFTVPACVPCPQVTITAPSLQGCAEKGAVGSFTAQAMGSSAATPIGYRWTISHTASGRQATVDTTTVTALTNATVPPWSGTLATTSGAVDLSVPGTSYRVDVLALYAPGIPFEPNCAPSTTIPFSVPSCVARPTVSSCSVTAGMPGTVTVTFDSPVDPLAAGNPANYLVSINGATPGTAPAAGTVSYSAATTTTTLSGFTLAAGDSVSVAVSNVTDPSGTVLLGTPSSTSCPVPTGPVTTSPACGILLWVAIVLLLLGGIVVVIGVCTGVTWVIVLGAILGVIGLVLFIIWIILCSAITPCAVMRAVQCVLFVIVAAVAPVVVVLLAIFGGLWCGLAGALTWGGYGALLAWLDFVMRRVGCPPTC